jgi:hypothetical protein
MSNTITCPQCQSAIEITEVISAQLESQIRNQLQTEFVEKNRKLADERVEMQAQQKRLADQESDFAARVQTALAAEKDQLLAKARLGAKESLKLEMKDQSDQLVAAKAEIAMFQEQELELRRKTRELERNAERQALELERKLDERQAVIQAEAVKRADEESSLKLAERDQKIEALAKQLKDAQRKLEQGSQQIQGDVQEVALEALLKEAFPRDEIERVGKGVNGGDVLHRVFDSKGRECGTILWESKRTKNWDGKWIGKAIDDQQNVQASCVCILSAVLPKGIEGCDQQSGVWIADWKCAQLVACFLRESILQVAEARAAMDGQHEKSDLLYKYMSSEELKSRMRGMVEPLIEMEKDLQSEARVLTARWKRRRKQLGRAMVSASAFYGDVQGIIGSSLPQIEGLELKALESPDETENSDDDQAA